MKNKANIVGSYEQRGIAYEIKEHIATLAEHEDGWSREVNIVSWNNGEDKIDIRAWSEDHQHMGRGLTLPEKEAWKLAEAIVYRRGYQIVDDDLNII